MSPEPAPDPARQRFFAIHLIRLTGLLLAGFGLLAIAGRVDLPKAAGVAMFVVGLIDAIVVPLILARKWRTPPQ